MVRWAWNKSAAGVKRRYFELVRQGLSGVAAVKSGVVDAPIAVKGMVEG